MPFKSKAQWRWCFSRGYDWCHDWAHETPGGYKSLPERQDGHGMGEEEMDFIMDICSVDEREVNENAKEQVYEQVSSVLSKSKDSDLIDPLYYFFLSVSYYQLVLYTQKYISTSACYKTFHSHFKMYKKYKETMTGLLSQKDYIDVVVKNFNGIVKNNRLNLPEVVENFLSAIRARSDIENTRTNYIELAMHLSSLPEDEEFRNQMVAYWLMKFSQLGYLPDRYTDSIDYWLNMSMKNANTLDMDGLHLKMNEYLIETKTSDRYSTDKAYSKYRENVPFEQLEYGIHTYTFTYKK